MLHKRVQAVRQFFLVGGVGDAQSLALENAEPLFDLIHSGAMHRRMMELEAGMLGQPGPRELALVHPQVVEHDVNGGDGGIDIALQFPPAR